MSKKGKYTEGASVQDKKSFAPYLSEDEELILVTGYGGNYIRHKFIYYWLWPGGIGWITVLLGYFLFKWNLGAVLMIGFVVSLFIAYLKSVLTFHAHRYLLTTRRLIIKNGFFAVKLISALFDKITHIEVEQSFMDRVIMKHGTVIINTAGGSKDEIRVEFIDDPMAFKNLLERLINRERERFGGSTGPVVTVEGELVE